jgi:dCMP deaminase
LKAGATSAGCGCSTAWRNFMKAAAKRTAGQKKVKRASWDEYFMRIAMTAATRSTCDRKHVGAVIVRDKTILSTGYNGSIRGLPHCDEVGHMMENSHCVATVHAEANAIIQAAKHGTMINGADIYITASPCWNCFKLIANSGIKRIFYHEFYRDERIIKIAKQAGIELKEVALDD